jgi:lauroyl/myristoyl acyltransferase
MSLRDALRANQVVVLQGDRAMPGQKYESVPVFGGHLRLPVGPFKLALASGSPVIPIFTVMTSAGRCRIFIEPAIEVSGDDLFAALASFAQTLGRFISKYPDQWLVLHPAFEEDQKPVDQRAEAIA